MSIYHSTMKLTAKDSFEANKFCYIYGKIINFIFVTITKDKIGNYVSQTTKQDVLRFFIGFPIALYIFYDTLATNLKQEKRSIIFEIILVINGKVQTLQTGVVMLQMFLFRSEYFKILKSIEWIDMKVKF